MNKSGLLSIQWQFVILCMSLVTIPAVILGIIVYGTFYQRSLERTGNDLAVNVKDWKILAESYIDNQTRIIKREEFLVRKRLESIALDTRRLVEVLDKKTAISEQTANTKKELAAYLATISIGRSGEVFVIDESGEFVIPNNHRNFLQSIQSESINHLHTDYSSMKIEEQFRILRQLKKEDTLAWEYPWCDSQHAEERTRLTVFARYAQRHWLIGASMYHTDYKSADLERKLQQELKYKMAAQKPGITGFFWVINSRGEFVISKNMYRNGENIIEAKDSAGHFYIRHLIETVKKLSPNQVLKTKIPWREIGDQTDREMITTAVYVPQWDWIICAGVYQTDALKELRKIKRYIVLIVFVALIIGGVIAYYFSRFIAGPLDRLEDICIQAAEGNLDIEMEEKLLSRYDEVGGLARAFFQMMNSLKKMIKQLAQSEMRFRNVVENAMEWVWETDADARYTYSSSMTKPLLGYTSDLMIGKYIYDTFYSEDHELLKKKMMDIFAARQPLIKFVSRNLTENGKVVWLSTSGVPVFDGAGQLTGYRGMSIDITEKIENKAKQKQLQKELNQAQKLEAIGTLAAGIAHEINTPTQFIGDNVAFIGSSIGSLLAMIKVYQNVLHQLQERFGDEILAAEVKESEIESDVEYLMEELPRALSQTAEGVERVTKIVRAMKEFSHIGKDEKEMADINRAIESTVTVCRNEWKYVAELELSLEPELQLISCYPADVNQVIMNLVINAAHAIGEVNATINRAKGKIIVATKQQANTILISIADNGAGIAEKNQSRIFDPFFTTKEIGKGTGQGLSMAYQTIVEKHKGRIWFDSIQGQGTTFFIELPISNQDKPEKETYLSERKQEAKTCEN